MQQKGTAVLSLLVLVFILTILTSFYFAFGIAKPPQKKVIKTDSINIVDYTPQPKTPPYISNIEADGKIKSPQQVKGFVPSGWMFEGVFPIILTDAGGTEIARTQANETTPGSWQSGKVVEFNALIKFGNTLDKKGFIKLIKDNPSGLPENDKSYKLPISF